MSLTLKVFLRSVSLTLTVSFNRVRFQGVAVFDTAKLATGHQDCELSIKRLCGDIDGIPFGNIYIYTFVFASSKVV